MFTYIFWVIFGVKVTFEMLTVRGQQHSFSTQEWIFLWKCQFCLRQLKVSILFALTPFPWRGGGLMQERLLRHWRNVFFALTHWYHTLLTQYNLIDIFKCIFLNENFSIFKNLIETWCLYISISSAGYIHDDVIKRKHFLHNWHFVRGIHQWPMDFPQQCQWHGAMMFSLCDLSKQLRCWWFEMPLSSLWCHCNVKKFSNIFWAVVLKKWFC